MDVFYSLITQLCWFAIGFTTAAYISSKRYERIYKEISTHFSNMIEESKERQEKIRTHIDGLLNDPSSPLSEKERNDFKKNFKTLDILKKKMEKRLNNLQN